MNEASRRKEVIKIRAKPKRFKTEKSASGRAQDVALA